MLISLLLPTEQFFFVFSPKRKEYDPRHLKTPILNAERGFLVGGKLDLKLFGLTRSRIS